MKVLERLFELKKLRIGERRKKKYLYNFHTIEKMAGAKLDNVLKDTKKTISLVEKIQKSDYAANTKKDFKILIKQLWKVAHNISLKARPEEIENITTTISQSEQAVPKNLIKEEEFSKLCKAASVREKAVLYLLYEAGLRVSEVVALDKNSLEFISEGVRVSVPKGTKTGARTILVIDSEPALANWLSNHPLRQDDAPLFVGKRLFSSKDWTRLTPNTINNIVRGLAGKAGIKRRIFPHLFRHTAATRNAKHQTEAEMKSYFGWVQSSKMAAVYVHLSGKDTDNSILAMHNKKIEKEKTEDRFEPQTCKRCGKQNAHDAKMCAYCGLSFDKEKAKSDMLSMQGQLAAVIDDAAKTKKELAKLRMMMGKGKN